MIRGGEQKTRGHPDFPSTVFGYVQFREGVPHDRFDAHAYSTPFESDWFALASRVERSARSRHGRPTEPTFLIAKFELVTVEAIDSRDRSER